MRPPNDAEFTTLVSVIWPQLYRTAYLLVGEHALAEDLTQTALAKTYANWRKVRSLDAAPSYARTTLINTAGSWFRKKSWRNEKPTETLPELPMQPESEDGPALLAALKTLPRGQRTVVVLRYYADLSVAETAATLGVSEGTVKSQTSAGLAALRAQLGDLAEPLSPSARDSLAASERSQR